MRYVGDWLSCRHERYFLGHYVADFHMLPPVLRLLPAMSEEVEPDLS
jgi:hypothetical protein